MADKLVLSYRLRWLIGATVLLVAGCAAVPGKQLARLVPPASGGESENLPPIFFSMTLGLEDLIVFDKPGIRKRAEKIGGEFGFEIQPTTSIVLPDSDALFVRSELKYLRDQAKEALIGFLSGFTLMAIPLFIDMNYQLQADVFYGGKALNSHLYEDYYREWIWIPLLPAVPSVPKITQATLDNMVRHLFADIKKNDVALYHQRRLQTPEAIPPSAPPLITQAGPQPEVVGVAIYPFLAKGGAEGALAEALTTVFASEIARARCVRVVAEDIIADLARQAGLEQACGTESCQIDLAKQARADFLVRGELAKLDDQFVLTSLMINLHTKQTTLSERVWATRENLPVRAEELAQRMSKGFPCPAR